MPERRWPRLCSLFPAAAHVVLGIDNTGDGSDDASDGLAGFTAAGLDVQRETVLTATALGEPPHPSRAAQIRPLTGDSDWEQSAELRALCDAEDDLPGGREFTEARIAAQRRLAETGQGAWFGAFQGDKLAAHLGVCSDGTGTARYQDVATHPHARRQGLAATLVCQAGRYAIEQLAATTLVIVADPGESAIGVYRSVGFADRETQISLQRPPGMR